MKRKIYVASSWRNVYYPDVVAKLREAGHDVYDFRASHGTGPCLTLILIYYSHHRVALLLYNKVEGVGEEEFAGIRKRRENWEVTEIVCIFAVKNKGVDYEIDKGRSIETL